MRRVFILVTTFAMACSSGETPAQTEQKERVVEKIQSTKSAKASVSKPESEIPSSKQHLELYGQKTDTLLKLITDKAEKQRIHKLALELTELGTKISTSASAKLPQCKPYLDALLKAAPKLHTLSSEAIELDYHKDGKLPKAPSEDCHHVKDLVVHPATVAVLVMRTPRAKPEEMLREMLEVKGHAYKTQGLLK